MSTQGQVQFSDDGHWWWDGSTWRSVQTDPPPAAAAPQPTGGISPAVAAVVRPQRFVAANPAPRHKYAAPIDGTLVDGHDVATLAVMLPLVSLWDEGIVDFSHSVSKKLMLTFNSVKATVKQDVERPGMTGQLLGFLKRNQDVDAAVRRWLGREHPNPWNFVIGTAVTEGEVVGFYSRLDAQRNFVAAAFKGAFTLEINSALVYANDPEVDRLAATFARHRTTDPVLHEQMWKKIHGTIEGNTERSRNDDI